MEACATFLPGWDAQVKDCGGKSGCNWGVSSVMSLDFHDGLGSGTADRFSEPSPSWMGFVTSSVIIHEMCWDRREVGPGAQQASREIRLHWRKDEKADSIWASLMF